MCIVKFLFIFSVFSVYVTLDPDTAYPYLILSSNGRLVRHGDTERNVPDNPNRFNTYPCVLGKVGFSSRRFYFEVLVKGRTAWILGVARGSIDRKGGFTLRPSNGYWTVWLRNGDEYSARDEYSSISLSLRAKPQRVGVFVDYDEGLVSFHDVESGIHIYSFTSQSFTDSLYPFFGLNGGSKNSSPLIINSVQ